MYSPSLLPGLLSAAITTVTAQGCYGDGMSFNDMRGGSVDDATTNFCTEIVPKSFKDGQTVSHCYPFPRDNSGDRVEVDIKNLQSGHQGISFEECHEGFKKKLDGCPNGGKGGQGGFSYRIDPNAGKY